MNNDAALFLMITVVVLIVILVVSFKSNPKIVSDKSDKSETLLEVETDPVLIYGFSEGGKGKYLVFDLETTGLPLKRNVSIKNFQNWPAIVSIGWLLFDEDRKCIEQQYFILRQLNPIPFSSVEIHGITDDIAEKYGHDVAHVLELFSYAIENTEFIISHNLEFDAPIVLSAMLKHKVTNHFSEKKLLCTMKLSSEYYRGFQSNKNYPRLSELLSILLYNSIYLEKKTTHNSLEDAKIASFCFFKLIDYYVIDEELHSVDDWSKLDYPFNVILSKRRQEELNNNRIYGHEVDQKKVVITGLFDLYSREMLRFELLKRGAIISQNISDKTDYVLIGNDPEPSKLEKIIELSSKNSSLKVIYNRNLIDFLK